MFDWEEAVRVMSGQWTGRSSSAGFTSVSTDTRTMQPGALFVCLKGRNQDGHVFAQQAVEQGAAGILVQVDTPISVSADVPVLRVPRVLEALGRLAQAWRRKVNPRVVAITGSSGKTSTKEMVAAYLGRFGTVAKTEGNYNNELGVPLTLLALRPEHQFSIVEMGMRGPGEIAYLAEIAEPDIGVITNIGSAHIERLGSREAIAAAKAELWRTMKPGALAIMPADDPLATREAVAWGGTCVSWSLGEPDATVWASDVQRTSAGGQVFTAYWKAGQGHSFGRSEVRLPLWGDHHRGNALAALAVGWGLGLLPDARLELRPDSLPGRSRSLDWNGITIVDDSYNANPESMRAALQAFCDLKAHGRRFAALGEMAELGPFAPEAHLEVARFAELAGLDGLILVGDGARAYLAGLSADCAVVTFPDPEAAAQYVAENLVPGDRLLLKASRSVALERLLAALPRTRPAGEA